MRKSKQFLLSRSNIFCDHRARFRIIRKRYAIGRTRNETFPTKLFYNPTLNKDAKRRRETKTRRKTFSSGRMSSWSLVGSRSWNVRYRPRKIITRSSGPTVYLLYSPVHLLLSVTIPRTKFPEYLYLVSARIENFRNNFV